MGVRRDGGDWETEGQGSPHQDDQVDVRRDGEEIGRLRDKAVLIRKTRWV